MLIGNTNVMILFSKTLSCHVITTFEGVIALKQAYLTFLALIAKDD